MGIMLVLWLAAGAAVQAQEPTRGVGVYPGDPKEYFGPTLRVDASTYRNLALRRPAYHSSAYDYNLTAQLVTDGIKTTSLPRWRCRVGGSFSPTATAWGRGTPATSC